jgi:hypothetical protein
MHCLALQAFNVAISLSLGFAQVEKLMDDRPDMRPVILATPALHNFLVADFAGLSGGPVHWHSDPLNPNAATGGQKIPRYFPGSSGKVWVTSSPKVSAEEKCAILMWCLQSIRASDRWAATIRMVQTGTISREDYVLTAARVEFEVLRRTRDFLREHQLKEFVSQWIDPTYHMILTMPDEFQAFMRGIVSDAQLEYYRAEYDKARRMPLTGKAQPTAGK